MGDLETAPVERGDHRRQRGRGVGEAKERPTLGRYDGSRSRNSATRADRSPAPSEPTATSNRSPSPSRPLTPSTDSRSSSRPWSTMHTRSTASRPPPCRGWSARSSSSPPACGRTRVRARGSGDRARPEVRRGENRQARAPARGRCFSAPLHAARQGPSEPSSLPVQAEGPAGWSARARAARPGRPYIRPMKLSARSRSRVPITVA